VTFAIPEARLAEVKRYMTQGTLSVEARPPNDPDAASKGRIGFVDNQVDPTTGTIRLKGTFPNENRRLWPGQFVNVTVTLTTDATALVVPTAAVQAGQQGQYVFTVKPDQTVELRNVTVARAEGAETVIQQGLAAGETVVTDGQLRLVPGTRVSIKSGPGAQATP
jgi:membrane fusion protein, multidrug efflux system